MSERMWLYGRIVPNRSLSVAILSLHFAPELTGNAPYTSSLAHGLQSRGHSVRVITAYPHYPEWKIAEGYRGWSTRGNDAGVQIDRKLHYVPSKPSGLLRLISEISFGIRLVFARWGNPDVVVLVSPALFSSALAGLRIRWGIRRPAAVTWVQDLYSLGILETGQGGSKLASIIRSIESSVLRSSTGVAVIHPRFKDHVVDRLGVPAEAVRIIRNWSHLVPPENIERDRIRSLLKWHTDETIVLHAGNMGAKQGLDNVVAAARYAEEHAVKVRFVLMGGGNQLEHLKSLAKGASQITFMGPLPGDEFQLALASADILLVNERPGLSEMSVPSKLTSYFSTGVPVLAATDKGSVTAGEIEASGGGLRVDAGDPAGLVETARRLAKDRKLARALGVAGREFRAQELSENAAIDRYVEWLEVLAGGRGR